MKHYLPTALLERPLGSSGHRLFLKMDVYQPTGSFKVRGMDHLVQTHLSQGRKVFVASSGGNAGLSLAYAARQRGARAVVVVPTYTSGYMKDLIRAEGADLRVHGAEWKDADELARALVAAEDGVYVSPFEDPLLWAGHSSLIDEVVEQLQGRPFPEQIVVATGGGGLFNGIAEGLQRHNLLHTRMWVAETKGAASFALSLREGRLAALERIDTVAGSLGARQISPTAFEWAQQMEVRPLTVSDAEAVGACREFAEEFRVVVEPACGAALAAVMGGGPRIPVDRDTLVVVCGGASWRWQDLADWQD